MIKPIFKKKLLQLLWGNFWKKLGNSNAHIWSHLDYPWSSLVKEESLACQITSRFNKKLSRF